MSFNSRQKMKSIKHTCQKCGEKYSEKETDFSKTSPDGSRIENEFVPLCPRCFKKWLKSERKKGWLNSHLKDGHLSIAEVRKYQHKEICEAELNAIIRSRLHNPIPEAERQREQQAEIEKIKDEIEAL